MTKSQRDIGFTCADDRIFNRNSLGQGYGKLLVKSDLKQEV